MALLRGADPAEKAQVYRQLGVELTYNPQTHAVDVQANLDHLPSSNGWCPRSNTVHNPTIYTTKARLSLSGEWVPFLLEQEPQISRREQAFPSTSICHWR